VAYRIRFHPEAKAELEKCHDTYPSVLKPRLSEWLNEIARESELRKPSISIDIKSAIEHAEEIEAVVKDWPNHRERFWDASFLEKLRAVGVLVSERRPPYETRVSYRVFTVFSVDCEVVAIYLVNHAAKEVVFMNFDGLPMQGYD
jgi:hypothetical protein